MPLQVMPQKFSSMQSEHIMKPHGQLQQKGSSCPHTAHTYRFGRRLERGVAKSWGSFSAVGSEALRFSFKAIEPHRAAALARPGFRVGLVPPRILEHSSITPQALKRQELPHGSEALSMAWPRPLRGGPRRDEAKPYEIDAAFLEKGFPVFGDARGLSWIRPWVEVLSGLRSWVRRWRSAVSITVKPRRGCFGQGRRSAL